MKISVKPTMSNNLRRPPAISILLSYVNNLKAATKTKENDILIFEPQSIGDIFQTLSLVNQLKIQRNIDKINFISTKRSTPIIKLFNNVNNVLELNNIDYLRLELFSNTEWYKNQKNIVAPCTGNHIIGQKHEDFIEWASAFFDKNPMEFRKETLGLPSSVRPELPHIPKDQYEKSVESAKRQGLNSDSLIIFNHAHSAHPLPSIIYKSLLDLFPGGVYYDAWANNIPQWAKPLKMSLVDIPTFADLAGAVINVRSGITELLSMSKANIYTIYPDTNWLAHWFQEDPRAVAAFRSHGIRDLQLNPESTEKKIFIENSYTKKEMAKKIYQIVSKQIPGDI